jgi:uncharacterized protein YneF (UPF0154 family)
MIGLISALTILSVLLGIFVGFGWGLYFKERQINKLSKPLNEKK